MCDYQKEAGGDMNANNIFNGIKEMNEAYKDRLQCTCEENMDRLLRSWICPKHGFREPNYFAIWAAEERGQSQT